jgi:outer membrane protein assembly factor BamB
MEWPRTRRQVLALVASGSVVGSAGCLGTSSESDSPEETQSTPTLAPTVSDVDCNPDDYPSLSDQPPAGAWSPTRGNQRRTCVNLDVEPLGLETTDELQATELFSNSLVSRPVVANGMVYLTDSDGQTHGIDVESGETQWTIRSKGSTRLSAGVTQDTVYIPGIDHAVQAVDPATGGYRWRTSLFEDKSKNIVRTVPVVAGGNVIVGHDIETEDTEYGQVTALDARCGSERWSSTFDQESLRGLATDGDTVYAATVHSLAALDAEDGSEHWRVEFPDVRLEGPPALAGESVVVKDGGDLYVLSTDDGSVRWTTRDGLAVPRPPTVMGDSVYAVEGGTDDVHALDIETGETRWRYTGDIATPLAGVPGRLYGFEIGTGLVALDMETGTKQAHAARPHEASLQIVDELAITPAGLFVHSKMAEGGNPEEIHRFTPG